MREGVAARWVLAASFVLVSILMTAEAKAQALDRGLSLREMISEWQTPAEIKSYPWGNFVFGGVGTLSGKSKMESATHKPASNKFLSEITVRCEAYNRLATSA